MCYNPKFLLYRLSTRTNLLTFEGMVEHTRGLILGRGFVPVPSSFAVKSLGLGVREQKIQSLGFGVRELKTRNKNALSSHKKYKRYKGAG